MATCPADLRVLSKTHGIQFEASGSRADACARYLTFLRYQENLDMDINANDLDLYRNKALKKLCRARGLATGGTRGELMARLVTVVDLAAQSETDEGDDDDVDVDDDDDDAEEAAQSEDMYYLQMNAALQDEMESFLAYYESHEDPEYTREEVVNDIIALHKEAGERADVDHVLDICRRLNFSDPHERLYYVCDELRRHWNR